MTSSRFLLLILIAHILVPVPCHGNQARTLVVLIDHDSDGFRYQVAGKLVSPDLLTPLRDFKAEWPTNGTEVILLVHKRASLSMIDNARGMIEKAGYEPPRVFYFDENKRAMVQLTFSPAIPFSEKGPS